MSANGGDEGVRLLHEIRGKLEWALRVASQGGGGEAGEQDASGRVSLEVVRAASRIAGSADQGQTIDAILDAFVFATQSERAFLMLLEEGRKLRFKAGRAIDQETVQSDNQGSKTVIRKVIQTGETVLIADPSSSDVTSSSLAHLSSRSILCIPLKTPARPDAPPRMLGIVYLDSRITIKQLGVRDAEVASALSEIASAVLEVMERGSRDADLSAKVKGHMNRLLDVGRAIGSILVLEELLQLIMEKALEVTRADRGFLMLLEGGKPVFKIGRAWNKAEGANKKFLKIDESGFFFSRTIVSRTLEEGHSVCIKDTVSGGEDASLSIVQMELASVMCTPLRESGNTLGLLYVDSKAANREFDQNDLELFEALAGQAAIGIKNALLVAQVKDKARLESEIHIAAQMQQDMCPRVIPKLAGIDLAGTMVPAKEVGGDYYDFVEDAQEPGKTLSIVVGDVSGKGLGSGIVAVMARCFLRSMITAYGVESPSTLLTYLNSILSRELKPGVFMTMLLLVWDADRKSVRYAAAGHEHLIVWRARTRRAEAVQSGGTALGLSSSIGGPTPDADLVLAPGDAVVLYSDGVTEAMNERNEEFELERLVAVVNKHGALPASQLLAGVANEVAAFRGKADQSDDITLVALRRTA